MLPSVAWVRKLQASNPSAGSAKNIARNTSDGSSNAATAACGANARGAIGFGPWRGQRRARREPGTQPWLAKLLWRLFSASSVMVVSKFRAMRGREVPIDDDGLCRRGNRQRHRGGCQRALRVRVVRIGCVAIEYAAGNPAVNTLSAIHHLRDREVGGQTHQRHASSRLGAVARSASPSYRGRRCASPRSGPRRTHGRSNGAASQAAARENGNPSHTDLEQHVERGLDRGAADFAIALRDMRIAE